MNQTNPQRAHPQTDRLDSGTLAAMTLWVGVISGLLEAALTIALRSFPVISPYHKAGEEVFVVAPTVNVIVLFVGALVLGGVFRLVPAIPQAAAVFGVLVWVGTYAVLSYPRVVSQMGVAVFSAGVAFVGARFAVRRNSLFANMHRMWMYPALGGIAAGAIALGSPMLHESYVTSRLPAAPQNAPNVLIIVVDTLRSDRLSAVGYPRATTPNLDRIAREGVLFESAFATASWTLPSHTSLLTGRYTYEHKMDYPVPQMRHGHPYLQTVLRAHGYRTGIFTANNYSFSPEYVSEPFLHNDAHTFFSTAVRTSLLRKLEWQLEEKAQVRLPPVRRAEEMRERLLKWIGAPGGRPFFALVNFFDVHEYRRWPPPAPFASRFGEVDPGRWKKIKGMPPKDEMDRAYDAALAYVDAEIGRLFEELQSRGLIQNTLVVITSDHGEALGEHGEDGHTSNLYREQIQIPLILSYPGRFPAGERRTDAVSLAWLPRTISELSKIPGRFPGKNLAAAPGSGEEETEVLAEYHTLKGPKLVSLATSRWHYIVNVSTGKEELFDLRKDPTELTNLAGTADGEQIAASFRARLAELLPALRDSYGPKAFGFLEGAPRE
jgi:arylsulfatase A-like enzyme